MTDDDTRVEYERKFHRTIALRPYPNGGWVITNVPLQGYVTEEIAAFSSAREMVDWLDANLCK